MRATIPQIRLRNIHIPKVREVCSALPHLHLRALAERRIPIGSSSLSSLLICLLGSVRLTKTCFDNSAEPFLNANLLRTTIAYAWNSSQCRINTCILDPIYQAVREPLYLLLRAMIAFSWSASECKTMVVGQKKNVRFLAAIAMSIAPFFTASYQNPPLRVLLARS